MASGSGRSGNSSRSGGAAGSSRSSSSRASGNNTRGGSKGGSGSKGSDSSSRSSSGSRSTQNTGNRARAQQKAQQPQETVNDVSFGDYLHAFTKTKAFRPTLVIVVSFFLILIDLLVAWNKYDLFFKILGFEILIVGVIWIFSLIMSMSTTVPQSRSRNEDEE